MRLPSLQARTATGDLGHSEGLSREPSSSWRISRRWSEGSWPQETCRLSLRAEACRATHREDHLLIDR